MRPNLRTFVVLILTLALSMLAVGLVRSGGWTCGAPQAEVALALARKFGTASWLGLAGLQLIAVMAGVVPASLVGMAAGALFGVGGGFAVSGAGLVLGALAAFGLSRSLFRPLVERAMRRRSQMRDLDAALGRDGWRFVCLLRVSPLTPFVATSYMLGLSAVSLRDYMLGTLAALPALFGYVTLGALADAGLWASKGAAEPFQSALLAVGFVATAIMVAHVGALIAKAANAGGAGPTPPA